MSRARGASRAVTSLAALSVLFLLAPAPASAAKLTCLTGTDPAVANDDPQIRAVQSQVDDACVCAGYDGTKTKKHGDYVKCATGVVNAAADGGGLRMQCKGTVKKFYAQSSCGFAPGSKAPCIKKTLSNGKVGCSIKATTSCVSMPGKTEQNACAGDTTCIGAADTNDDLRIGAPGDSGQCNPTTTCGDNVREGAEQCDGPDLGGASCITQGFVGGTLACSGACTYDTSACIAGGGLTVQVLRASGLPVAGAKVSAGGGSVTTGDDGTAGFSNLPPGRTVARVEADGFASSTAVVDVVSSATTPATVSLLPLGDPIEFDADVGVVATRGGVQVTIPAGGLVDDMGNPVTGDVSMTIAVLDPTTSQVALAPGPFQGLLAGGGSGPVDFESILMAEISLTQGSTPLTLAPGQTATLDYTLPDALQGVYSDGETIEAWFYDLDAGLWQQEGTGTIVRINGLQHWIVTVSHFTWWNCDRPWTEKNCVEVTVTQESDGTPISGATVLGTGETYYGTSYGQTDDAGVACIDFKANSVVRVTAEHLLHGVQVDGQRFVAGNLTPATCSGLGFGVCQEIAVELTGQTCVNGTVFGPDGTTPFEGADVHAVVSSGFRSASYHTTSGADGSFCVPTARNTEVSIEVTATSGGELLIASDTATPSGIGAMCGQPGCTPVGPFVLAPVPVDTCVRGRVFLQSSSFEQPHGDAGVPVYLYSDFPLPSCSPGQEDPATWGTLVTQTVTDDDGYFCIPFSKLPYDSGGSESAVPRGAGGGGSTSTRYVVPGDCVTRSTYGSAGAFPRQIVEQVLNPNRSCEDLDCIDAGDINMFFGGYGSEF